MSSFELLTCRRLYTTTVQCTGIPHWLIRLYILTTTTTTITTQWQFPFFAPGLCQTRWWTSNLLSSSNVADFASEYFPILMSPLHFSDTCLKWRILPFVSSNVGKAFEDDWVCSMNADPSHNRCTAAEQTMNMPEGVIKKDIKTKEQKKKEIEDVCCCSPLSP
jgi:hypothetical protein